jgi:hypothetical protein
VPRTRGVATNGLLRGGTARPHFFNIDLLKSDINDPANPCGLNGFPARGCEGTTEIYGFFRSTLGFKELFGWRFGNFLTNISFKVGGDGNAGCRHHTLLSMIWLDLGLLVVLPRTEGA